MKFRNKNVIKESNETKYWANEDINDRFIEDIQDYLIKHGYKGFAVKYDKNEFSIRDYIIVPKTYTYNNEDEIKRLFSNLKGDKKLQMKLGITNLTKDKYNRALLFNKGKKLSGQLEDNIDTNILKNIISNLPSDTQRVLDVWDNQISCKYSETAAEVYREFKKSSKQTGLIPVKIGTNIYFQKLDESLRKLITENAEDVNSSNIPSPWDTIYNIFDDYQDDDDYVLDELDLLGYTYDELIPVAAKDEYQGILNINGEFDYGYLGSRDGEWYYLLVYGNPTRVLEYSFDEINEYIEDNSENSADWIDESLKESYNSCLSIADEDAKKFKDEWVHNDDITMADILISLGYESADDVRFYKEFNDGNAIVFDFAPYEDEYDYIYYYVIDQENNIPKGYTKTRLVIDEEEKYELNPDNLKGSWNKKVIPHNTYYDDYADDFYESVSIDEAKKDSHRSKYYKGMRITLERKGGVDAFNVYDEHGELYDSGFKSLEAAKKYIDKEFPMNEDWTVSDSGERVYVDDKYDKDPWDYFIDRSVYYIDDGVKEHDFDTYEDAVAFADDNNVDLIRRANDVYSHSENDYKWIRDASGKFNAEHEPIVMTKNGWKKKIRKPGDQRHTYLDIDESLSEGYYATFNYTAADGETGISGDKFDIIDAVKANSEEEAKKLLNTDWVAPISKEEYDAFIEDEPEFDSYIIWYNDGDEEKYFIVTNAVDESDAVDQFSITFDPSLITDVHKIEDYDYHVESLNEKYSISDLKIMAKNFGDNPDSFVINKLEEPYDGSVTYTNNKWEDGVPVLKSFGDDYIDVKLPAGKSYIYDTHYEWAYFPYRKGWIAIEADEILSDKEREAFEYVGEGQTPVCAKLKNSDSYISERAKYSNYLFEKTKEYAYLFDESDWVDELKEILAKKQVTDYTINDFEPIRYFNRSFNESLKEDKTYNVGSIPYMGREFIQAVISTSDDSGVVRRGKRLLSNLEDDSYYKTYMNSKDKHKNAGTLDNQIANFVAEVLDDIQDRQLKKQGERIINLYNSDSLTEDTVKQNNKWVNKGKEGTHGKFRTKKAADAQRKAMFANGYKEGLKESVDPYRKDMLLDAMINAAYYLTQTASEEDREEYDFNNIYQTLNSERGLNYVTVDFAKELKACLGRADRSGEGYNWVASDLSSAISDFNKPFEEGLKEDIGTYTGEPSDWAENGHSVWNNPKDWEYKLSMVEDLLKDYPNAKINTASAWGASITDLSGKKKLYTFDFWEDDQHILDQLDECDYILYKLSKLHKLSKEELKEYFDKHKLDHNNYNVAADFNEDDSYIALTKGKHIVFYYTDLVYDKIVDTIPATRWSPSETVFADDPTESDFRYVPYRNTVIEILQYLESSKGNELTKEDIEADLEKYIKLHEHTLLIYFQEEASMALSEEELDSRADFYENLYPNKLKEAATKPLTPRDKADIKKKIDTTNDSELIAAYVNSKVAKKKNTNQSPFTESADGKANDATDIVKLIDKEFPELEFVDERDLDNNQVGLIFDGASNVDQVDLGTYLDGLYVWYKIKGDKLLIKADEDANYLEEDVKGGWEDPEWRKYFGVDDDSFYDPYELEDNIDIEYDEEEDF